MNILDQIYGDPSVGISSRNNFRQFPKSPSPPTDSLYKRKRRKGFPLGEKKKRAGGREYTRDVKLLPLFFMIFNFFM